VKFLQRFASALSLVLLSACASTPRIAENWSVEQRRDVLARCAEFSLRGKIAVQQISENGREGGSGRFQWTQENDVIDFSLSAPLSQQTWRLAGMPGAYTLTDSKGETRQNASAEQLVWEASGWTLPVSQLRRWVLGLADDSADVSYGPNGLVETLRAEDWLVSFQSYDGKEPKRPLRITAEHPQAKIKLIVQQWRGCAG
jgi:outer membrane lipoprotein LolB